ncbi:MAG TPA: DUF5723 family protein [Bacteroidales bacterium]|nr:DUF5723 family protein [Bacteroidales bacterium]
MLFTSKPLVAQYFTGSTTGSFSGVNNVVVNPALMSNSRYYLDVNIMGSGSFFYNNFAYFARDEYNLFRFLSPGYQYPQHAKEFGKGERAAYTVENTRLKNLFVNGRILGPSAMLAVNNHTFALFSSFRTVSSFREIPYDVANYFYYSLDYRPQHGTEYDHRDPIKTASLSWSEVGFSWAYMLKTNRLTYWSVGLSARALFGHAAYYAYIDNLKYFVPDDDNLFVNNVTGDAAYAFPIDYSTNDFLGNQLLNGMGMGFDMGVSYTHAERTQNSMKYKYLCQQRFMDYKYRIGISLMDLGWIRFNNRARHYSFEDNAGVWHQIDTLQPYYNNLDYISQDINERICGSAECALESDRFSMYLPFSLGIQADYHVKENWYVSGTMRLPINYARSQVRAPGGLMVAPRMETEDFEFGVPITLHDFKHPFAGAYLRFYNITIGTDNIAGFMNLTHHYGFDFYFSLKFSLVKDRCKKRGARFCLDDSRYQLPSP